MNNNIEEVIFFGRLGKNPDLKYTVNRKPVCELSVAENTNGNNKVKWHQVVVWGRSAEMCSVHLRKGSEVFVKGKETIRNFITKDGVEKGYKEFLANSVGLNLREE